MPEEREQPHFLGTFLSHSCNCTNEKIDQATGMLELKTGVGMLSLHFPPPSIKDLKVGDTISVYLSYTKETE